MSNIEKILKDLNSDIDNIGKNNQSLEETKIIKKIYDIYNYLRKNYILVDATGNKALQGTHGEVSIGFFTTKISEQLKNEDKQGDILSNLLELRYNLYKICIGTTAENIIDNYRDFINEWYKMITYILISVGFDAQKIKIDPKQPDELNNLFNNRPSTNGGKKNKTRRSKKHTRRTRRSKKHTRKSRRVK